MWLVIFLSRDDSATSFYWSACRISLSISRVAPSSFVPTTLFGYTNIVACLFIFYMRHLYQRYKLKGSMGKYICLSNHMLNFETIERMYIQFGSIKQQLMLTQSSNFCAYSHKTQHLYFT